MYLNPIQIEPNKSLVSPDIYILQVRCIFRLVLRTGFLLVCIFQYFTGIGGEFAVVVWV